MISKWDKRFLRLAKEVSTWSKDPSTQVGAVIVDNDNHVVSLGYNGFPSRLEDTEARLNNRDLKLLYTIHGEMNAVLNSPRSVNGCTLYTWPFMSCDRCAIHMIQAGIVRCVSITASPEIEERWKDSLIKTRRHFYEAGVRLSLYDRSEIE